MRPRIATLANQQGSGREKPRNSQLNAVLASLASQVGSQHGPGVAAPPEMELDQWIVPFAEIAMLNLAVTRAVIYPLTAPIFAMGLSGLATDFEEAAASVAAKAAVEIAAQVAEHAAA